MKIIDSKFGGRRIAFSLVVLVYLGFLGFINVMMFLPALGWLPANALSAMGHFGKFLSTGDTHDLIHELVFAFIVGTAAVGLLSQLWKPKENFSGQLVALIAWVVMVVIAALTNNWIPQPLIIIFGGLTLLATILHPAGFGLFNWVSGAKPNKGLLALVIIAAVPLLALTFTNIGLQTAGGGSTGLFGHNPPAFHGGGSTTSTTLSTGSLTTGNSGTNQELSQDQQKHIALGHYRNIAALSFIIILVGLLASFRPPGPLRHSSSEASWRLAAWVAGFLPIFLGLASVVLPNAESSLGLFWGLAAIVWGIVFIAAAQFTRRGT